MKIVKSVCLFLLIVLYSGSCFGQKPAKAEPKAVSAALHQSRVGTILFTDRRIAYESLTEERFLKTYRLTPKSDLFFVAYFSNPLTDFKRQLLPAVSQDSLFRSGNYQFSIAIDNVLVYQSNLMPGAPPARSQDADTYLNRPLIDNTNGQGTWSESFWNRFMNHGGEKALTDGTHVLKMEIRPYVKTDTVVTGPVMASGELLLEVNLHPTIDASKIRLNKVAPYPGLPISHESFDTQKIKELKGAIDAGLFKKINSVVVLKNGKILIEEYFNGENRESLHDPRSVGKSFASTLTGIAINDGFIKSETQPLGDFYELEQFENFTAAKQTETIEDLLTMSSGFEGDDDDGNSAGNEENMYPTANWVQFALDLPYNANRKEKWHYFTAGVVLLGDILNKSVPNGLEKYADDTLFKPLGIQNYKWQYTPQNVPNTAGGIQLNALDFAKYGQLYKNGGIWNGRQIVPKEWVEKTFTKQKTIEGRENEYYGYLFWNKIFTTDKKKYDAFYCAGNGGNYILVFPNEPLVIVITASAYGQPYAHTQVTDIVSRYLLPAISK